MREDQLQHYNRKWEDRCSINTSTYNSVTNAYTTTAADGSLLKLTSLLYNKSYIGLTTLSLVTNLVGLSTLCHITNC